MRKSCSMCLMPFSKDTGNRESENHCSYCFKNGDILFKGTDVHEFNEPLVNLLSRQWHCRVAMFGMDNR